VKTRSSHDDEENIDQNHELYKDVNKLIEFDGIQTQFYQTTNNLVNDNYRVNNG